MSANLYATKNPNEYYHIHGSLEASTTLKMMAGLLSPSSGAIAILGQPARGADHAEAIRDTRVVLTVVGGDPSS